MTGTAHTAEIPTSHGAAGIDLAGLSGAGAFLLVLTHGAGGGTGAPDLLAAREAGLRAGAVVALVTQPYRKRGARAPGSAARQDEAWLEIIAWLRANVNGTAPLIQGGRSNGARVACRTAKQAGARGVIALAFPLRPPGRRPPVPAAPGASARAGRTAPGRAGQGHSEPERAKQARAAGDEQARAAGDEQARAAGDEQARAAGAGQAQAGQTRVGELREAVRAGANVLVVNGDRDPFGIPDTADATRVVVLKGETHALSRNPAAVSEAVAGWLSGVVPVAR